MVLVANGDGRDELDNQSEPRVERLSNQQEPSHGARNAAKSKESRVSAKAHGKNNREEPALHKFQV